MYLRQGTVYEFHKGPGCGLHGLGTASTTFSHCEGDSSTGNSSKLRAMGEAFTTRYAYLQPHHIPYVYVYLTTCVCVYVRDYVCVYVTICAFT